MTNQPHSGDVDDQTRIQPSPVREFNEQLARAYTRPQEYSDHFTGPSDRPLPPETTTKLPPQPPLEPPAPRRAIEELLPPEEAEEQRRGWSVAVIIGYALLIVAVYFLGMFVGTQLVIR